MLQAAPASRPAASAGAPLAQLRALCIARIDPSTVATMAPDLLAADVERLLSEIATQRRIQLNGREQRQLARELVNDMLGLGPLEPLLDDDAITDIMVNGPDKVFVERRGKLDAGRHPLPRYRRMSPMSASASPPRSAAASTRAARWSMPG